MIKLFKRLFCNHNYSIFKRKTDGFRKIYYFKCTKCGKQKKEERYRWE